MQIIEKNIEKQLNKELEKARFYIANPGILQSETDEEILKKKINSPIHNPYPNLFTHKMTYYKGFVKNPQRLKNYLKATSAKNSVERDFYPFIMDIEPNRTCNFHCIMCLHGQDDKVVKPKNMTYEDFIKFIQANDYIMEVKLHGLGEPLLVKKYELMMKFLIDNYIWSRMVTNGSLLHKNDIYKYLIDIGVGEIQCSFDGTNPAMLEKIRRGSCWETVFNNLKKLNNYANKKGKLITRMWTVIQKENRKDLLNFVNVAAQMEFRRLSIGFVQTDWGDDSLRKHINEITPENISDREKLLMIEKGNELGVELTFWNQNDSYSQDNLCPWVFQRPYISAEWKVVPCCILGDPNVKNFGDASNLKEIWKSKAYQDFRQMHIDGNIPDYCKTCYKE